MRMEKTIERRTFWPRLFCYLVLGLVLLPLALLGCEPACANSIPAAAQKHRALLERSANVVWGLNAPMATFAAQIHQESRWRADARSPVGAEGLSQFMPTTTEWIAAAYPKQLGEAQPYNPGWAMRALVHYDRWLFERLPATAQCERWAMVLSAYNGGLGWVQRDRKLASEKGSDQLIWFNSIEKFNAGRSAANFNENRHYPRVILSKWESLYEKAGWGNGVCEGFTF